MMRAWPLLWLLLALCADAAPLLAQQHLLIAHRRASSLHGGLSSAQAPGEGRVSQPRGAAAATSAQPTRSVFVEAAAGRVQGLAAEAAAAVVSGVRAGPLTPCTSIGIARQVARRACNSVLVCAQRLAV